MSTFHVDIVTPSKTAFEGKVKSLTIPGTKGSFQVLYNHAPLISSFEIGQIKIEDENGEINKYATSGGTIEVMNNKVIVLAETFERPMDIDVARAESALERAKKRKSKEIKENNLDIFRVELAMRRALNRLKLAKKF